MHLTNIEVIVFEPRFLGSGYKMSFGNQTQLFHRLIRLTADDGTRGFGEFVHPAIYDLSEVIALEDAHLPNLEGISLADLPALLKKWRGGGKLVQGMVFGIELAMFDLIGRKLGVPVSSVLGGAVVSDMPEYLSLSSETPETMAAIVHEKGGPYPFIQAKLGVGDISMDLERVHAVLAAMRPGQKLLADFNCALQPDDAIRALPEIDDTRVMWEEPCEGYEENLAVARAIKSPVMFDQCLENISTFVRAIKDGAAAALVIKPDALGGLSVGRSARDICDATGMDVRIDGWWSGQIAGVGALHLAIGAQPSTMMATIDLTDPLNTSRDLIVKPVPGRIAPAPGPGIGPVPEGYFQRAGRHKGDFIL